MTDNALEDNKGGTDETASPPVKIPITVKHHITPPDEPDDFATGAQDPAREGGAEDAFFVRNDAETTTQSAETTIDPYNNFNFIVAFEDGETHEQTNGVTAFVDASNVYGDDVDDDDHDIIFDPAGDLLPPVEPVGMGDAPHQGSHDIGGYFPSTIIAGATGLQTAVTEKDTGSAEGTAPRAGEGETLVHEIGHWLGVTPATGDDGLARTRIMQSVEPTLDEVPDREIVNYAETDSADSFNFAPAPDDSASPVVPEIIIRTVKDCPPPPSIEETVSGSPDHFTQMAWADTRDSAGDGFDIPNRIVFSEILLKPENEFLAFASIDDPEADGATMLPDLPSNEDAPDWGLELA